MSQLFLVTISYFISYSQQIDKLNKINKLNNTEEQHGINDTDDSSDDKIEEEGIEKKVDIEEQ